MKYKLRAGIHSKPGQGMETPHQPCSLTSRQLLACSCHRLLGHIRPYPEICLLGYSKYKCMKITSCQNTTCKQNKRQYLWHLLSFRKPFLLSLRGLSQRHGSPRGARPQGGHLQMPACCGIGITAAPRRLQLCTSGA